MSKASSHISSGSSGFFQHNSRETFSLSQVFSDEKNECSCSAPEAFSFFKNELKIRSEKYTERTNQKLQKKAITHLSMIVNLEAHHTLKDLKPLQKYLEEKLDTKVFQVAIHRDEGKLTEIKTNLDLVSGKDFFKNPEDNQLYFDKKFSEKIDMSEYKITKNYHAHIEMLGLDSEGNSVKRNRMNRTFLRELQTFTAQSLGMQRGRENKNYTREQVLQITAKLKPKNEYKSSKEYGIAFNRVAQDLGIFIKKTKRLDTHEFKAKAKVENDAKKESYYNFRDYQKQITALENVNTEQKRELHKLNSAVKNNKAEVQELQQKIQELSTRYREAQEKAQTLAAEKEQQQKQIEKQKEERSAVMTALMPTFQRLSAEKKEPPRELIPFLHFVDEELISYSERETALKTTIRAKDEQILVLQEKIPSASNMSDLRHEIRELDIEAPKDFSVKAMFLSFIEKIKELRSTIQSLFAENIELKSEVLELKLNEYRTELRNLDAKEVFNLRSTIRESLSADENAEMKLEIYKEVFKAKMREQQMGTSVTFEDVQRANEDYIKKNFENNNSNELKL